MSMDWANERYVRLYTRDTPEWLCLSFLAQGLFALLMRKVSRAGVLELGKVGRRGVFIAIGHGHQAAMLDPALEELLADGCVQINGTTLVIPNFLEAQETPASEAQRQRNHREKIRDNAIGSRNVTPSGHDVSRDTEERDAPVANRDDLVTGRDENVTGGHAASRPVTPNCAVPSVPSVPPIRSARMGVGSPAFEAVSHWTGAVWPRLSAAECPDVQQHQAQSLAALSNKHGAPAICGAMDAAAADEFWGPKLDLDTFIAKHARWLGRKPAGPAAPAGPKPRRVVSVDALGQPVFEEAKS